MLEEIYDKSHIFYDDFIDFRDIKCCKEISGIYKYSAILKNENLINTKKDKHLKIQLTDKGARIVKLLKEIKKIEKEK